MHYSSHILSGWLVYPPLGQFQRTHWSCHSVTWLWSWCTCSDKGTHESQLNSACSCLAPTHGCILWIMIVTFPISPEMYAFIGGPFVIRVAECILTCVQKIAAKKIARLPPQRWALLIIITGTEASYMKLIIRCSNECNECSNSYISIWQELCITIVGCIEATLYLSTDRCIHACSLLPPVEIWGHKVEGLNPAFECCSTNLTSLYHYLHVFLSISFWGPFVMHFKKRCIPPRCGTIPLFCTSSLSSTLSQSWIVFSLKLLFEVL